MDIRPLHKCTTKRANSIQVVDKYGTLLYKYFGRKFQYTFFCIGLEHRLQFAMCSCEPVAVTMSRAEFGQLVLLIVDLDSHLDSLIGQRHYY